MFYVLFVSTVSLRLMGSTFILVLSLAAPHIPQKVSTSSDLLDEKAKTFLMRILQRRAQYPTLIPPYWDRSTRRAQLCFSYEQPTFDSYPQDRLLSCCVLIRGVTVAERCPRIHKSREEVRLHSRLLETPAFHSAGA